MHKLFVICIISTQLSDMNCLSLTLRFANELQRNFLHNWYANQRKTTHNWSILAAYNRLMAVPVKSVEYIQNDKNNNWVDRKLRSKGVPNRCHQSWNPFSPSTSITPIHGWNFPFSEISFYFQRFLRLKIPVIQLSHMIFTFIIAFPSITKCEQKTDVIKYVAMFLFCITCIAPN